MSHPCPSANMVGPIGTETREALWCPEPAIRRRCLPSMPSSSTPKRRGWMRASRASCRSAPCASPAAACRRRSASRPWSIPAAPSRKTAIAIHGITDDMVADGTAFRRHRAGPRGVCRPRDRHRPRHPLRPCRAGARVRAGRAHMAARFARSTCACWRGWRRPRWPTTALIACANGSASNIKGRHTALGDAEAAGDVFLALVPLLRAKNIRTLAEAEAASRALAEREARTAPADYPAARPRPAR